MGAISLHAQADFTWKYEPQSVGAANRFGYAVWTVPLTTLSLGGAMIPLRAEFSTDPRPNPAPSPLGRGWLVNFFNSALVEVDQDSIRWHRPDGRIFFFILERGNTIGQTRGPKDPIIFTSKDNSWTATKVPKRRFITLNHLESGAEFVYEEGLLVHFSFGSVAKGAERYSINYNRNRRPTRLLMFGSGKTLAEFIYDNPERANMFRIGDSRDVSGKSIDFEYADFSLRQFQTGPYLSKIGDNALTPLNILYEAKGGDANRVGFERSSSPGMASLVWDSKSGFIRDDQGASYKIENLSLVNGGRPAVDKATPVAERIMDYNWRPDEAKITKIDRDGSSEFRFYDRAKGILTERNKEGVSIVTNYLLTPGPMYGKVRKIEEVKQGKSTTVARHAYDHLGRDLRHIDSEGNITFWEYSEDGNRIRKTRNTILVEEFNRNADNEYRTTYGNEGIKQFSREKIDGMFVEKYTVSGKLLWEKLYDSNLRLLSFESPSGLSMKWDYNQDPNFPIKTVKRLLKN